MFTTYNLSFLKLNEVSSKFPLASRVGALRLYSKLLHKAGEHYQGWALYTLHSSRAEEPTT